MGKNRDFNHLDVFFASWTDGIQEFIDQDAPNFQLTCTSNTVVRGVAGTGDAQASVGVGGLWRYRTTNYDVTHPGGGAATYDIYAIASAPTYSAGDVDTTDYLWYLQIKASGVTPTGNTPAANAITQYRKVGEVDWDGTKITGLRQWVLDDWRHPISPTAPIKEIPAVRIKAASGATTESLLRLDNSSGTQIAGIDSQGLGTFNSVQSRGSATGTSAIWASIAGDANYRFQVTAGGKVTFADGAGTVAGTIDQVTGGLVFYSGNSATERLRLNATGIGLFGVTPAAQSTGWGAALATNFSGAASKKTLTSSYTMNDLRDVLATVIDALRTNGFLGT